MNKPVNHKRALMLIMGALVMLGFGLARAYYKHDNSSVDPRIREARELYKNYDAYAENNNFQAVFLLLDSIELIYKKAPHYKHSYEMGVVYNNRAAAYISMAINFDANSLSLDGVSVLNKDSLLSLAFEAVNKSIVIYQEWIHNYSANNKLIEQTKVNKNYFIGLENYSEKQQQAFLKKRLKEMEEAQLETPRRLSVAYTNLGIIKRHEEKYEEAAAYYQKAIELWDRNLAAENNLNTLLGRPHKKRSVLEKLFPPEKDK